MLVDLEWTSKYELDSPIASWLKEFNAENGGLIISHLYPEEVHKFEDGQLHKTYVAERVAKGIYWTGGNFHLNIRSYTDFKSGFGNYNKRQNKFDIFFKMDRDSPEFKNQREEIFKEIRKIPTEYGTADNLKQIYKYGKYFIKSEDPYVLSLNLRTQKYDQGFRWHKNGPYIGKHKRLGEYFSDIPEIDNIISFHFYELERKS